MIKMFIVAFAALSFAACTSNPTYTTQPPEYRNPAGLDGSLNGSSNALAGISGDLLNVSVNVSQVSWNGSKQISEGLWDVLKGSGDATKDVAIIGWNASENSSAFVVAAISEVPRLLSDSARHVVTTSGQVFEASVNGAKTAIGVSVKLGKDSSDAIVHVGDFVLGSVKMSATAVADVARWSSEKTSDAVRWSVDASGQLLNASGEVIGHVVDTSGRVVHFALEKTGKFLTISGKASVAVIHGSSAGVEATARAAGIGLKKSGQFLASSVTWTAQKTAMIFTWSVGQSKHSSTIVSNVFHDIIRSTPEVR